MHYILLFFAFVVSGITYAQEKTIDCEIMKSGRFHEKDDKDASSYYLIDEGWFYDYSNNGKHYIKSRIEWQNDCTYMLTLVETNIPQFDLTYGTKLRVEIMNIQGNEITYQYLPAGVIEPGVMIKLDD